MAAETVDTYLDSSTGPGNDTSIFDPSNSQPPPTPTNPIPANLNYNVPQPIKSTDSSSDIPDQK